MLTICVVVLVIFLFLRNLSATLIPGCAVPFSIVGTFAVMYLLGYSLNNLSLMALTLSVGFVVDDAIVMLENIVRHMEMGEIAHAGGACSASREIGFTILSMTVLAGGRVHSGAVHGRHRGPPAARVLRDHRGGDSDLRIRLADPHADAGQPLPASTITAPRHGLAYRALEGGFNALTALVRVHARAVAMRFRLVTLSVAILMLVGTVYLFMTMPTGFIPSQDSGFMFAGTLGPQDISFDSMAAHNHAVGEILRAHPDVQDVGVFVGRRSNQAIHVRAHEAARAADPFGGPDHRGAAPQDGGRARHVASSCRIRRPSRSAARIRQRVYQLTLQSVEPAGDLRVGAAAHGQDARACPASWTSTATCRSPARR